MLRKPVNHPVGLKHCEAETRSVSIAPNLTVSAVTASLFLLLTALCCRVKAEETGRRKRERASEGGSSLWGDKLQPLTLILSTFPQQTHVGWGEWISLVCVCEDGLCLCAGVGACTYLHYVHLFLCVLYVPTSAGVQTELHRIIRMRITPIILYSQRKWSFGDDKTETPGLSLF